MLESIKIRCEERPRSANQQRQTYRVFRPDGTTLLESCKDPLTDGARALAAEMGEFDPKQVIELVKLDGEVMIKARLAWAADRVVMETAKAGPRFGRYVAFNREETDT